MRSEKKSKAPAAALRFICAILLVVLGAHFGTPARAESWFQETPKYNSLATDPAGFLYAAGNFSDAKLSIGNTKIDNYDPSGNTGDAVVVKYNDIGKVLWATQFGGTGADDLIDIAADAAGNVYALGTATGAWITPPSTALGTSDAIIVKVDANGAVVWARRFGGAGAAMTAKAITTDGSGNILFSGTFTAADTTIPPMTRRGMVDAFLIKLDAAGNLVWGTNFGGGGTTMTTSGLAADRSGNAYLTAAFTGNNPMVPAIAANARASFLMKVDASGGIGWTAAVAATKWPTSLYNVGVDGSGNVYVAGSTYNVNSGGQQLVLWKLAASGDTIWLKDNASDGAAVTSINPTRISMGSDIVHVGGYNASSMIVTGFVATFGQEGNRISWQDYWGRNSGMSERSPIRVLGLASDSKGSFYFSADAAGWMIYPMLPSKSPYLAKYPATASADTASTVPQTGWWYNPSQTGRGIAIEYYRASGKIYMGAFAYDSAGAATWQVGICTYDAAAKSCTGNLDTYRGGATISDVTHATATLAAGAGRFTFNFVDSRNGTVSWNNDQFPITRFRPTMADGTDTAGNASFYTGWYWDPATPGRGYFLETWKNADGNVPLYGVGYMYRQDGSPVWYVMPGVASWANPSFWDKLPFIEFGGGSPSFVAGNWKTPDRTQQIAAYPMTMRSPYYGTSAIMPSTGTYISLQHFVP